MIYQKKLAENLKNDASLYPGSSVYTILYDLVSGNSYEEVKMMLKYLKKDIERLKGLEG